ncbi:hypothetical protein DM860_016172 [Cuscuta australis]|uniref:Uncharacterized protein n=1 Tax=Cuscuta australis TaxID=267555 RepID=A0A328E768_9ASTE|nr:hypothetical protein DM860_016172 [Cuscuta australis]
MNGPRNDEASSSKGRDRWKITLNKFSNILRRASQHTRTVRVSERKKPRPNSTVAQTPPSPPTGLACQGFVVYKWLDCSGRLLNSMIASFIENRLV